MMIEGQSEVIAFLSAPKAFGAKGDGAGPVARIDTHISSVFLYGDKVLKLKRAVKFPYLDFSTRAQRRKYCRAEVAMNTRTAPRLYEGVCAIVRDSDGNPALVGEDEADAAGEILDWVVAMKRFDEDTLFDRMAARGALSEALMDELGEEIAAFHREAQVKTDFGGAASMEETLAENAERLAAHEEAGFAAEQVRFLEEVGRKTLERARDLLEERRRRGYVRHCHGDLHLRNICLFEGRPTLFDGIEFSDSFANIDVLYDLAFLLMDLEHRGLRALANRILCRYFAPAAASFEEVREALKGLAALPLFLSCRAGIRAHTGAEAALAQRDEEDAARLREESRAYLGLACGFLEPPGPRLVAVGGFSGSGKTTIARLLAPQMGASPGALILRSDVIRKHLFGRQETEPLPEEAYRPEVSDKVFAEIAVRAQIALGAGHSVIADGVYGRQDQRAAIEGVAKNAGTPFDGLWLKAPRDVMARRIGHRIDCPGADASDATPEVLDRQLTYDIGKMTWKEMDASGEPDAILAAARNCLL